MGSGFIFLHWDNLYQIFVHLTKIPSYINFYQKNSLSTIFFSVQIFKIGNIQNFKNKYIISKEHSVFPKRPFVNFAIYLRWWFLQGLPSGSARGPYEWDIVLNIISHGTKKYMFVYICLLTNTTPIKMYLKQ